MAQINQQLLAAIMAKTRLSRAQAYVKISKKAGDELLPRHLAAIKVAADEGININKYASADDIAELRSAGTPVLPPAARSSTSSPSAKTRSSKSRPATNASKSSPNQVFVVHGRDRVAKDAMFSFLRAIGIKPIEWNAAIRMTKKATPYVGEILDAAFSNARAVVVLLTPDDWAELREDLRLPHDPPYEKKPTGQARPNVLFEAGMAFSSHADRTVLVQLGNLRPFSDTAGRHVLQMTNAPEKRKELAVKLQNAGCKVDLDLK